MPINPFQTQFIVNDEPILVQVAPDARLRKTARWTLRGTTLSLRVPMDVNRSQVDEMLGTIQRRVIRQRKRARKQADIDLMARAEELNKRYFGGQLSWHTIRWVGNMQRRLGSCTTGGATDGDIRISDRIRSYPTYVIDYILAHEICHRKYPNHSPEFWEYLGRYPHVERARGFIEGIAFGEGLAPDDLLD